MDERTANGGESPIDLRALVADDFRAASQWASTELEFSLSCTRFATTIIVAIAGICVSVVGWYISQGRNASVLTLPHTIKYGVTALLLTAGATAWLAQAVLLKSRLRYVRAVNRMALMRRLYLSDQRIYAVLLRAAGDEQQLQQSFRPTVPGEYEAHERWGTTSLAQVFLTVLAAVVLFAAIAWQVATVIPEWEDFKGWIIGGAAAFITATIAVQRAIFDYPLLIFDDPGYRRSQRGRFHYWGRWVLGFAIVSLVGIGMWLVHDWASRPTPNGQAFDEQMVAVGRGLTVIVDLRDAADFETMRSGVVAIDVQRHPIILEEANGTLIRPIWDVALPVKLRVRARTSGGSWTPWTSWLSVDKEEALVHVSLRVREESGLR